MLSVEVIDMGLNLLVSSCPKLCKLLVIDAIDGQLQGYEERPLAPACMTLYGSYLLRYVSLLKVVKNREAVGTQKMHVKLSERMNERDLGDVTDPAIILEKENFISIKKDDVIALFCCGYTVVQQEGYIISYYLLEGYF